MVLIYYFPFYNYFSTWKCVTNFSNGLLGYAVIKSSFYDCGVTGSKTKIDLIRFVSTKSLDHKIIGHCI